MTDSKNNNSAILIEEISEIKKYYDNIISLMPGHVYWKDRDGTWLGCNILQARDLGLKSPEDCIGKNDYDFFPKKEADLLRENDLRVMETGLKELLEEPMQRDDGSISIYLSQKVPLINVSGEIIGLLGISFDITEIKDNERKLQSEKKQAEVALDNIIANLPEHVYWKNNDCIYMGCNDSQAKSLGLDSRKKIVGKSDYDFSPENIANEIQKIDLSVIRTGASKSVHETIIRENGDRAVVLSKKVPLVDEERNVLGVLGISFDITAEKEAEQLRIEKKAAEERAETMQLIAASIAHELRTPLRAIETGAGGMKKIIQRLLETYQVAKAAQLDVPYISPVNLQSLEGVCKNIARESEASFSILDMLLIKAGVTHVDQDVFTECSMRACIDEALERYSFKPGEREMVHWQPADFSFYGDSVLMNHIIFNLLKNALHYIRAVARGEITLRVEQNEQFNVLYFKDTGQGIAPDILPHIFDRFFTRTAHGTGVGLAFCRMVMESFGGDIHCDSLEGKYTEFTMRFPIMR